MRKLKRIIAAGIAAVMVLAPCVGEVSVVRAEEETQPQVLLEMPVLTSIKLANVYGIEPKNIATPAQIDAEIGVRAPAGMKISGVRLSFTWADVGIGDVKRSYDSPRQENWIPGEDGGTIIVPMVFDKYMQCDDKKLTEVIIYVDDNQNSGAHTLYQRTREWQPLSGTWYPTEQQPSETTDVFEYDGAIDYRITASEEADMKGPTVTSVEVVNADISEQETVTLNLNYKEETGVDSAYVMFSTESGKTEAFEFQKGNDEEYVNEGTLQLTSTVQREQGEEYKLQSVELRDREGNYTAFYKEDERSDYLTNYEGDQIPVVSYKVKGGGEQVAPEYLMVQEIKFADGTDKDNVTAGQTTLDAVATVYNNTGETVTVLSDQSYMSWQNDKYNGVRATGEKYTLAAGETGELHFPVAINRFLDKVTIVWTNIFVYYEDSKGTHQIQYSNNGQGMASGRYYETGVFEGGFVDFEGFEYTGTADFTVTTTDTPDTEAPYVKSIRIDTTDIKAPGTVRIEIQADDGNAKVRNVAMQFSDVEDPSNTQHVSGFSWSGNISSYGENMYYSQAKRCYIIEQQLDSRLAKGEYQLTSVDISDAAGQLRVYYNTEDGKLTDYSSGAKIDSVTMSVTESERKDRDFKSPILTELVPIEKDITIPGEVRYKVKAEEDSGIRSIEFNYKLEDGSYINFASENVVKEGEYYICSIKVNDYYLEGQYELNAVAITDGSGGKNISYYSRKDNILYSGQNGGHQISYSGEVDTNLKRSVEDKSIIGIRDSKINSKLQALQNGATVTITGQSLNWVGHESAILTKETMQIIKDKKLKVRLIMPGYIDQVLFDGADITDEMVREFYIAVVERRNIWRSVDFGNAIDTAGYTFLLEGATTKIPLTLRFSVDEDFYTQYKDSNIRFAKRPYTERLYSRDVTENLKMISENGYYYVEAPLEPGMEFSEAEYSISTDTIKVADYFIETEAWVPAATNEVVVGNEFTYNMRISNDNDEVLKNVLVYPEMLNLEDGEGIDLTGAYQFTAANSGRKLRTFAGNDKVIITKDGDAIITELAKGESVELLLTVQLPETLETERVTLNTYAAIAKSETELEAFGSTNINLTLRQPQIVMKGDINEDGVVDGSDLMYMLQVVSERIDKKTLSAEQVQAGDVAGGDGDITADDLMKMLQFVSERITSLE